MTSLARPVGTLLSAALLVAVNLLPLVGVALWSWSLMMVIVLYWIESGIIGVVNVFKVARARAGSDEPMGSVDGNRVTVLITGMASRPAWRSAAPGPGWVICVTGRHHTAVSAGEERCHARSVASLAPSP